MDTPQTTLVTSPLAVAEFVLTASFVGAWTVLVGGATASAGILPTACVVLRLVGLGIVWKRDRSAASFSSASLRDNTARWLGVSVCTYLLPTLAATWLSPTLVATGARAWPVSWALALGFGLGHALVYVWTTLARRPISNATDGPTPEPAVRDTAAVLAAIAMAPTLVLGAVALVSTDHGSARLGVTLALLALSVAWIIAASTVVSRYWLRPLLAAQRSLWALAESGTHARAPLTMVHAGPSAGIVAASEALGLALETHESELRALAGQHPLAPSTSKLPAPTRLSDARKAVAANDETRAAAVAAVSRELHQALAELYAMTSQQDLAARERSEAIRDIAGALDSLSESARAVSASAHTVLTNAQRSLSTSELSSARINDLSGHTDRIRELVEVIREVANRSDILALNGALEATRAGDAGQSFGLVADEMRRLAERVTGSVLDVRQLVGDIVAATAGAVEATRDNRGLAEDTASTASAISTATRDQSVNTEQVQAALRMMTVVIDEDHAARDQATVALASIASLIASLELLAEPLPAPKEPAHDQKTTV